MIAGRRVIGIEQEVGMKKMIRWGGRLYIWKMVCGICENNIGKDIKRTKGKGLKRHVCIHKFSWKGSPNLSHGIRDNNTTVICARQNTGKR